MDKWRYIQFISISLVLISLFILIWSSEQMWLRYVIALLFVGLFFWKWSETKWNIKKQQRQKFDQEQRLMRLLNHYRHDWLNDLQLLFGYIKLKKLDKLENYVNNIKGKVEQESIIAKLNISSLALDLIELRNQHHSIQYRFELMEGLQLSTKAINVKWLHHTIMDVIRIFQDMVDGTQEAINELSIHISEEHNELILIFNYSGQFNAVKLESEIEMRMKKSNNVSNVNWILDVMDRNAFLKIVVPFSEKRGG